MAPPMLLAKVYAADVDVTQDRGSEKFDGVRAQWDLFRKSVEVID